MFVEVVDITERRPGRLIGKIVRKVDRLIGTHYEQDNSTYGDGEDNIILISSEGVRVHYYYKPSEDDSHLKISIDDDGVTKSQVEEERRFLKSHLDGLLD